jgi:hypothetical protein
MLATSAITVQATFSLEEVEEEDDDEVTDAVSPDFFSAGLSVETDELSFEEDSLAPVLAAGATEDPLRLSVR